jgi:FKBP-type peptidyl-prolyl cis-trans isomerase FklB
MNKRVFFLILPFASLSLTAQVTKPPVNPLKSNLDSISYVLGEIAAYGLTQQGLGDIKMNSALFLRGCNDVLGKKKTLLDDAAANSLLNAYMTKVQSEKSKPMIEAGRKFLAQNKTKPNVKTTASGLQYEVVREGTGIKPGPGDIFVANYKGTLLDGTEFDNSYTRGTPLEMGVNQVIKGWTEGLMMMPIGSKYKFWIPYELGYGLHGQGQIPGGAVLYFEVELLDVKKK